MPLSSAAGESGTAIMLAACSLALRQASTTALDLAGDCLRKYVMYASVHLSVETRERIQGE